MPSGHFYVGPAMILLDKDWTGPLLEFARAYEEWFSGYGLDPKEYLSRILMRLLATMRS